MRDAGPHPSQTAPAGTDYGYETWLVQEERRVVRVRDGRMLEYEVPRPAYVFWEGADVVRLVERDPAGTVTFLHEVRLEPGFLAEG